MRKKLVACGPYDLRAVVFSHGWSSLKPFCVLAKDGTIRVSLKTSAAAVSVTAHPMVGGLELEGEFITDEVIRDIRWMFRLDDDLSAFYKAMRKEGRDWIEKLKMGRLLRSQTVFEDVVKLVLTTNCSWSFTELMTDRLTEHLGEPTKEGHRLFASPHSLRAHSERFYRETIRAGYRSPHLPKLADLVLSGKMDMESWRSKEIPTDVVRKDILSLPGAGPYVADNLLRYLGRSDYLGLDSWARGRLKEMWKMKKNPTDKTIARKYKKFGDQKGLVLWCDLTHDWLSKPSEPVPNPK